MFPFQKERGWLWCALVATTVCLLVLPGLGAFGFWEPFEVESAIKIGAVDPWTARLPFALSGIATALLGFLWVARGSSIRVATLASLLLLSCPLFLLHSRQLISQMPAIAAQLLVLIGLTEALYNRRFRALAALGVGGLGLVLGYLAVGAILGVLVPLLAIAIVCAQMRLRWACLALALVCTCVALLAFFGTLDIGGTWHGVKVQSSWDLMLEQIAFGAFPWVVLAPMALLSGDESAASKEDGRRNFTRHLVVSWVATSLLATSVYSLHIAPTIFLAMPALAFAVARWVCSLSEGSRPPLYQALLLCLVVVMLGMNLHAFSDRLPALHLPVDTLVNGASSALHRNVLVAIALVFSALLLLGRSSRFRPLLPWALGASCVFFGAFVSHSWMPSISQKLSSSHLLHQYLELKRDEEALYTLGKAPRMLEFYVPEAEPVKSADLASFLAGESRVFSLVAQSSFCSLRQLARRKGAVPVLLAENPSYVLLSNQHLAGEPRKSELDSVLYTPEQAMESTVGGIEFAASLRLLRVDMPKRVGRGSEFEMRMTYEVLQRPKRKWKIFAHFDGPGIRFQADHWPIEDRCPSHTWNPGDIVVDIARVRAGGRTHPRSTYKVWTGFFYGRSGNWTRMPVTAGQHNGDRVMVGEVELY